MYDGEDREDGGENDYLDLVSRGFVTNATEEEIRRANKLLKIDRDLADIDEQAFEVKPNQEIQ